MLIVRSGIAGLLDDSGHQVVGQAADADALLAAVALERPEVAIVDIRMPPSHRDEGLIAARSIRDHYPRTAVLLLSEYLEPRYAERLLAERPGGLGYLLKHRVTNPEVLLDALQRVVAGECVVDPTIAERLVELQNPAPLRSLSLRERQTLLLMAEGRSNAAIAARLGVAERSVESISAQVFRKLGLEPDPDVNRRVLAVLAVLRPSRATRT